MHGMRMLPCPRLTPLQQHRLPWCRAAELPLPAAWSPRRPPAQELRLRHRSPHVGTARRRAAAASLAAPAAAGSSLSSAATRAAADASRSPLARLEPCVHRDACTMSMIRVVAGH